MVTPVFWCPHCRIPILKNEICPLCGTATKPLSTTGVCNPVFAQEKKLITYILGKNVEDEEIWYLGSGYYLIDGKRIRLPYIDFYKKKKHLEIAEALRGQVNNSHDIPRLKMYLNANEQCLKEIIFEAEKYIFDLVDSLRKESEVYYMPTVSFSGGKDSTVVSRIVRDALQSESIIHYFGDTTLEFPCTHEYVESTFRTENPFTPIAIEAICEEKLISVVSEIENLKKHFSSFVKIQLVYNTETGQWEFNYIATEKGEVIGTEKSYKKSLKKIELAFPENKDATKMAASIDFH